MYMVLAPYGTFFYQTANPERDQKRLLQQVLVRYHKMTLCSWRILRSTTYTFYIGEVGAGGAAVIKPHNGRFSYGV